MTIHDHLPSTLTAASLELATGGLGLNSDAHTKVAGGLLMDRSATHRTDEAYRLDAIRQACNEKYGTWWGGVDHAKAADCFLTESKR